MTSTGPKPDDHRLDGDPLARFSALPMFVASLAWLVSLGSYLHLHGAGANLSEVRPLLIGMGVLQGLFVAELVVHWFRGSPRWRQYLWTSLFPPLRLASRDPWTGRQVWLPSRGWVTVDRALVKQLERAFSGPMIVIALLMLPLLAMEYFWATATHQNVQLGMTLHLGTTMIWVAFAFEFLVMVAVVPNRLRYCQQHWIDLAIICLPLLAFARALRFGRLLRLQQVMKASRVYRLRGLMMRGYRAVLILNVIRHIVPERPAARLAWLREQLMEREEELAQMRQEIAQLEARLAEQAAADEKPPAVDSRNRADARPPRGDSLPTDLQPQAYSGAADFDKH